jgi:hypothetical protein
MNGKQRKCRGPRKRAATAMALSETTAEVTTDALRQSGIEGLRVLSESRFLPLLRRLVEAALHKRLGSGRKGLERAGETAALASTVRRCIGELIVIEPETAAEDPSDPALPQDAESSEGRGARIPAWDESRRELPAGQRETLERLEERLAKVLAVFAEIETSLEAIERRAPSRVRSPASGRLRRRLIGETLTVEK